MTELSLRKPRYPICAQQQVRAVIALRRPRDSPAAEAP